LEHTILSHLIENEEYARKTLPFLKEDYFHDYADKCIYRIIQDYVEKYNDFPTKEILHIELQNLDTLNEAQYKEVKHNIVDLKTDAGTKLDWLLDKTEEFCQDKAIHNAIRDSIKILDTKSTVSKGTIPKLLQEALQVSFDTSIGHDFIEDYKDRYDSYIRHVDKIEFNLHYLNAITDGGLENSTLTVLMASTGVGKSAIMSHFAAHNLMCNKNVLYISMEMAEKKIGKRIDANLLDIPMPDLKHLSLMEYEKKMSKVRETTKGKLIVKEYPTASAHAGHFRHLINELRIKKNFIPEIIYIDYINICASSRIKGRTDPYSYIKSIAEELRGLAMEYNLPIVTATQSNRGAMKLLLISCLLLLKQMSLKKWVELWSNNLRIVRVICQNIEDFLLVSTALRCDSLMLMIMNKKTS
jgi:replicative DNA helicase